MVAAVNDQLPSITMIPYSSLGCQSKAVRQRHYLYYTNKKYFHSIPSLLSPAAEELRPVPVQAVGDDRRRRLHGH